MATVTRTIIAGGGGDYTTIAAWEAATNLNSGNDIWKGVISDSSAYDESVAMLSTHGTGTSSYSWLTVDPAHRHSGVWTTSKARIAYTGTATAAIQVNNDWVRLDWLQIYRAAAGLAIFDTGIQVTASDDVLIDYCVIWTDDDNTDSGTAGIRVAQNTLENLRISNSVIYGWEEAAIWCSQFATGANVFHTIDIDYCALAVSGDSGTGTLDIEQRSGTTASVVTVYNTWFSEQVGTGVDFRADAEASGEIVTINGGYNAFRTSSIEGAGTVNLNWTNNQVSTNDITTTAPATAGIYITDDDHTATFDATPIDHANNVLLGNGVNRVGSEPDARQDFSIDITGATRPTSNVDIGPFQISEALPVPGSQAGWVKQTFTAVTAQSSWSIASGSPTAGNLLLAFLGSVDTQTTLFGGATGSPTPTEAFTELHSGQNRSAGGDCSGFVFWKVATGSEPANFTFDMGVSTSGAAHIVEISNPAATPIDGSAYVATASGKTQADIAAVVTTVDGCLLVALAFADEDSAGYEPYYKDPMVAGWTARYGSSSVSNTQGGDTSYSGIASLDQLAAGSTGTVSCVVDVQNDALIAYAVAVAPGAGPSGGGGGGSSQLRVGLPSLSLDG